MTDRFCEIKIMTVEIIFGPEPPNSCLNIYDLINILPFVFGTAV